MKNKTIRQAVLLVTTFEGMFALVFGILFFVAVVSVMQGAWWHIPTAVISFILSCMLLRDMKRINEEDT